MKDADWIKNGALFGATDMNLTVSWRPLFENRISRPKRKDRTAQILSFAQRSYKWELM